jgi:hypothetical protein
MFKRVSVAILGAVLAGGVAHTQPPNPYPETQPLPADLWRDVVVRARLDLEYRREGGPRRDKIEQILLDSKTSDASCGGRYWSYAATTACVNWVVDCATFVPHLDPLPQNSTGDAKKKAEYESVLVRREAYLQGLSASARHDVYRALIEGQRVDDATLDWLDCDSAALRALRESFDDLIPVIRRNLNGRLKANRGVVGWDLRIREAVISPDPTSALLALIREGVTADVKRGLKTAKELKNDYPLDDSPFILARRALRALRRVDPPNAAQSLKELLPLYRPVEEKWERDQREARARGDIGNPFGPPKLELPPGQIPLVGQLSRDLVEAIGDLGDRDFERTIFRERLGLPFTLWDRVNQVERELVKRGELKADTMVTGEEP